MPYIDGFVVPVPSDTRDGYAAYAKSWWPKFQSYGALSTMEAWGDDVPDGKLTDFRRAVDAQPGETVVFSWIIWPDKATRDAAMAAMMNDPDFAESMGAMPFDGKRMIYGGFTPIFSVDTTDGAA